MLWQMSHRAETRSRLIADRHYNRQKIGSPQFVPPGRCLVLYAGAVPDQAFWVTSYPFAEYVKHAWAGAWVCSAFRNENAGRASDLILDALAATRHFFGEPPPLGLVSFLDPRKVRPIKVRGKNVWGYTWLKAGFKYVGRTKKDNLMVFQILPEDMPLPLAPLPNKLIDLILDPAISKPISTISPKGQTAPMSALPITITISVNEHTPPHQLRAIQELLGFAVNPVSPAGNGAEAKPLTDAHGSVRSFDQVAPITPEAWAAVRPIEAAPPAPPTASAPSDPPFTSALPGDKNTRQALMYAGAPETADLPPIGPVIPAQVAAAATPAPAAGEKTPGKRGRQPSTPEEKAAAEQGGFKNVTEYRKHQAAKMLAAMQSALATPQAPASVADALRSKDPGALAAVAAQPPAEPVRSILRDQPGPGGTVYAEAAMPSAIPAMPTGNAGTPAPPPAAAASEWDKAADSDPYVSAQAVWDQLNALKPGASWFTLRNIFPQHSDVHSVPLTYVGDVKRALQAKIDELQPRAA